MNSYLSWIQRIPEMIKTLALLDREWIDRLLADLFSTCARPPPSNWCAGWARNGAATPW
jgi:hypothetical protein